MISLNVIKNPAGMIVYDGPSRFDGSPIVAIATGIGNKPSQNIKTGEMVQIWIIRKDVKPINALYSGRDYGVCGDCKHSTYGTCYVNLGQGVNGVYNALHNGNYTHLSLDNCLNYFWGRKIRLGAYGDPVAIPIEIWDNILSYSIGHTGYTHQWRKPFAQEYKGILMASVDTPKEYELAREMGWRTFRTRTVNEPLFKREFECPASPNGGTRLTCEECMACNGGDKLGTVSIIAHGPKWKVIRYNKYRKYSQNKKSLQELRIR